MKFDPVAINFFGISVYWYGILYALSFLIISNLISKTIKVSSQRKFNKSITILLLYNIVFARLFDCLIYNYEYTIDHPIRILNIKEGGLSFFGGVIGVAIGMIIHRKLISSFTTISRLLDSICENIPIGIFLVRIGNFINQELAGKPIVTANKYISMIGQKYADGILRHPSQIYESFLEGVCVFIAIKLSKRLKKYSNYSLFSTSIFSISYGTARFICEFFRDIEVSIYSISIGQIFSFILILFGLVNLREIQKASKYLNKLQS